MADKKAHGPKSDILNEIKASTKKCTASRKESNKIIDIISYAESSEKDILLACVRAFHKIFVQFLTTGEMFLETIPSDKTDKGLSKQVQYKIWLMDRYQDTVDRLVQLLESEYSSIQELALCTLMKFVETEGKNPVTKISSKKSHFPVVMFMKVMKQLMNTETNLQDLIGKFQEYLTYDDVRFHVLKSTMMDLKEKKNTMPGDVYLNNMFAVLERVTFPASPEEKLTTFLTTLPDEDVQLKMSSLREQKRLFTTSWVTFLAFQLPTNLYRRSLIILHDKVMPYMTSPVMLCDFLTESYNIGGAISLLALNGIFVLVQKYNLDYPDFYGKLYALFEPSIFHAKYRARFFYLADLFLTSTHLPAYLVGAFAKRLARISLTAPPSGLTVSIPFIYNLIHRHPNCRILLHRTDGPSEVSEDPYDPSEPDPTKCRAMESCLWELKTLQSHFHPDVARSAQRIDGEIQTTETDLSDLFEMSYDDLFDKETRKKVKFVPVNFETPKGLLGSKSDRMKLCWRLE
ncbi:LOW QUALITY PROTEIN: nucleolar complex protein 4 homolog B-like [Pecten maximus]|uniref:LOW QUALITY PROTEIN: nucleolar complex protein 4 homolog B-like n=1 Tax=Pecten maximus TaxID=6579 RepID=UPI0014589C99|nr:LOW QUALITY PROTEIN: nucleolar complex protein 4 homolog B-like [Pecten maximus]